MQHPFISDLSDKSLEELQSTITDLQGKLNFAFRMGNSAMISQLRMVIESYQTESAKRLDAMYKKQNLNSSVNVSKG
jgi:hypothetical protein